VSLFYISAHLVSLIAIDLWMRSNLQQVAQRNDYSSKNQGR